MEREKRENVQSRKKVRVNGGGGQRHNGGGMFRMKLVGDGRGTRLSRWTGGEAGGEMSRRRGRDTEI